MPIELSPEDTTRAIASLRRYCDEQLDEKIGELNSLAEMIGNKGKGKVWLICTSQQDLEKVVDRTNFQPALVGKLNARFELKPHLIYVARSAVGTALASTLVFCSGVKSRLLARRSTRLA